MLTSLLALVVEVQEAPLRTLREVNVQLQAQHSASTQDNVNRLGKWFERAMKAAGYFACGSEEYHRDLRAQRASRLAVPIRSLEQTMREAHALNVALI